MTLSGMDWIQGHLLINHLPVIGTWIGTGVLAWGLVIRKEDVRRLALGLLAIVALSAAPAFLSGSEAEDRAEGLPGVSSSEISDHESAATWALGACVVLGLAAIGVLLACRRKAIPAGWLAGVLCLALVCSALLAWTAHLGGAIRHPEIRGGSSAPLRSSA
jgi:hypothetical protein